MVQHFYWSKVNILHERWLRSTQIFSVCSACDVLFPVICYFPPILLFFIFWVFLASKNLVASIVVASSFLIFGFLNCLSSSWEIWDLDLKKFWNFKFWNLKLRNLDFWIFLPSQKSFKKNLCQSLATVSSFWVPDYSILM